MTTLAPTQTPNHSCATTRTTSPGVHQIHHPSPILPSNSVFSTLNPVITPYRGDSGVFDRNISITPHSNSLNLISYDKSPSPNDGYDKYYQKPEHPALSCNHKTPSPIIPNDKNTPSPPLALSSSHDSSLLTNYSATSIISEYDGKSKAAVRESSPNPVPYWQPTQQHQQLSENTLYSINYDYSSADYSGVTSMSNDYQIDMYRNDENHYKEKINYGESLFRNNNDFRIIRVDESEEFVDKRSDETRINTKTKVHPEDENNVNESEPTQESNWSALNQ